MIRPEDDHFHASGTDPYWNESACALWYVPERNIMGIIHMWHKPNLGCTGASVTVFDDRFSERPDVLLHEYTEYNPIAPGSDMFEYQLDCGLSCELIEPLKRYRWTFQGDGAEIDLSYEAITPPWERLNEAGDEGSMSEEFKALANREAASNAGHYSQGARATGHMVLDGERIEVASLGWRDHSWGPRKTLGNWLTRGGWSICTTESSSFDVWCVSQTPGDDDPILGQTERNVMGMYLKDGEISPITGGTRRIVERDGLGRALRVELEAVDRLGRTLEAEGRCKAWHRYQGFTTFTDIMSACEWQFDGQTGFGASEEFWSQRQNRRLVRANPGFRPYASSDLLDVVAAARA